MGLVEVCTGKELPVLITPVSKEDLKKITRKQFHFSWLPLLNDEDLIVFKLQAARSNDLPGLIAIQEIPAECRIEVKLLACSSDNVGKHKIYEGIAGNLLAFACRQALIKYGENTCVSLIPKTRLRTHYQIKYQMQDAGKQLYLEGKELNNLIQNNLL